MCLIQYCAKAVRRNLAEFAQNLPKLYIILNFWRHFYARIVPIILCKHAKFRMGFCSADNQILLKILFGERDFVEHFVC